MTTLETPSSRRFLPHIRMARKPYTCALCSGRIEEGDRYFARPERVGRKLHTRRVHFICPIPDAPAPASPKHLHHPKPKGLTAIEWFIVAAILIISFLLLASWILAKGLGQ